MYALKLVSLGRQHFAEGPGSFGAGTGAGEGAGVGEDVTGIFGLEVGTGVGWGVEVGGDITGAGVGRFEQPAEARLLMVVLTGLDHEPLVSC